MSELADRIRSQAAVSARAGQHDQLMAIANEVAELELARRGQPRPPQWAPDDDTLRDRLAATLIETLRKHDQSWGGIDYPSLANALLPVVRRHIEQARADEREAAARRAAADELSRFGQEIDT